MDESAPAAALPIYDVGPAKVSSGPADFSPAPDPKLAIPPPRDLELATYLAAHHGARHHLCASECETMRLADLLALADAQDAARWASLTLGYADPQGDIALRQAIAGTYETAGVADIACFAGAQEALTACLQALLSPGAHAIVVVPGYQSVETLARQHGAVTGVALDARDFWSLDLDAVAASIRPQTRVVAINFPNNPTGRNLPPDRFAALIDLCRRHGIWLLSDEVYRLSEHDGVPPLPAAVDAYERGISVAATSKALGLPGLRTGWVACRDPALIARLATLRHYLSGCAAGPSEVLATIALKAAPAILHRNRQIARDNLALLTAFLARHADLFACHPPQAGVVCYPQYRGKEGASAFAARMIDRAGVLLIPGRLFRSDLLPLPDSYLRIGFGRHGFAAGLSALEAALAS
jgi:aspartate/methionine/tyrosine aminotransferase